MPLWQCKSKSAILKDVNLNSSSNFTNELTVTGRFNDVTLLILNDSSLSVSALSTGDVSALLKTAQ